MTDAALPLAGRGVLVTGASSGIGRAIALAAARAGADVAVTYRVNRAGASDVERGIRALDRRAAAIRLDVTDYDSIAAAGPAAREALGRLDVWVNNAGADILTGENADLSDIQKLDLLLSVDLRGTVLASWRAAAILESRAEGGVIINMSWDHVLTGMSGRNPQMFAAVKGGILAFSKSLARSVAPRVGSTRRSGAVSTRTGASRSRKPRRSGDGARPRMSPAPPSSWRRPRRRF